MSNDRAAMFRHIRASKKIKSINDNVVIYKVKVPNNITLYLDANTFNNSGKYIEDCVFSYFPISADNIVNKEVLPIKGQALQI